MFRWVITALVSATAALAIVAISSAAAAKDRINNEKSACAVVKQRMAKKFPLGGPSNLWTCDFSPVQNGFYVMRLNASARCDYPCSNLLGWFAVRKSTGEAYIWDVAEMKLGEPLRLDRK